MESVSEEFPIEDEEVDPAADFLAREQSELAGLEDELQTSSPPLANGNESENTANDIPADVSEFELNVEINGDAIESEISSQSPLTSKTQSSNNNSASSNNNAVTSQNNTVSPPPQNDYALVVKPPREEPEKIKKWREEQKKSLEEKDIMEDRKKEEWRLTAKKELEDWYKQHEETLTRTRANNRNAEQQFITDSVEKVEPGTQWKRIATLCDFNKKATYSTKDASRMRSIILQLQDSSRKSI